MKSYITPEMQIIHFNTEDVITDSAIYTPPIEEPEEPWSRH